MSDAAPILYILCGKIAAGKSTLAAELARQGAAVLISEDQWLSALFGNELSSLQDYMRCALKLRPIMGPHVTSLLKAGVSVVLDFPANTVEIRMWMRGLLEGTKAAHQLHVLDLPVAVCLDRLRKRNKEGSHAFAATEEQYWRVVGRFAPPSPDEGFHMILHRQTS